MAYLLECQKELKNQEASFVRVDSKNGLGELILIESDKKLIHKLF